MLAEMAELGFEYVELSHGIRITLVEGIQKAVSEGIIKVASVHNFCPLPPHVTVAAPNLYEPTAKDDRERAQWERYTRRTIEFAATVGADRMIVHSGSLRFFWGNPERKLEAYFDPAEKGARFLKTAADPGGASSEATMAEPQAEPPAPVVDDMRVREDPGYLKQLEKLHSKMVAKAPPAMEVLREAFLKVLPIAKEKGVRICVENRESMVELPVDMEMAPFIASLPEPEWIGYWHDSGHAQIKERLGAAGHRFLLEANSGRHFGFHLHDVSAEGRDHQELGTGVIDFNMIRQFIRDDHLVVLEMSPRLSTEQVVRSRDYLANLLAKPAR